MLVVSAVVIAERRLTSSNLNGRKLAFGSDAALQRAQGPVRCQRQGRSSPRFT
jgi:hypothetical protein